VLFRSEGSPVSKKGLKIKYNGQSRIVDIDVIPVKATDGTGEYYFLVVFHDINLIPDKKIKKRGKQKGEVEEKEEKPDVMGLHEELLITKEYLQSIIEERESANEELRSALEEIHSSNEELQSTNEELETAKEELQSTNEELTTVNEELHNRNNELTLANNDLLNLLSSTDIPIVMLGHDLRIRRFTPRAEKVFNLISGDIGRPLSDLSLNIIVPNLKENILQVLDTLNTREYEIQDYEGRWYYMKIRPYRTIENKIDGVVIVVMEIDELKRAVEKMREAHLYAEAIVETVREPLIVIDADLRVKKANSSFYRNFLFTEKEVENMYIYNIGEGEWNIPRLKELLEEILPENRVFENFEMDCDFSRAGYKKLVLNARRICMEDKFPGLILLAIEEKKSTTLH